MQREAQSHARIHDLMERVRHSAAREAAQEVKTDALADLAVWRESDSRWGMFFLLLLVLKEILAPVRMMFMYPDSWPYKVSAFNTYSQFLPYWLIFCAALVVPLILMFWFNPRTTHRRTTIGLASIGLCGASFAFAYVAMAVSRFDVPWLADTWAVSATACAVVMLLLTASVNNSQRKTGSCPSPGVSQ